MKLRETKAGLGAAITLGYLALALAMTWPLMLHFRSLALTGLEDGAMSIWNLWWMKFSIFELGQSPLHSTYLFAPDGVSLTFHSLPKVLGLLSVPLQYLAGVTIAYNSIFLLTFVLTGITTYWLVSYLLGERLPAFLAGAFFAFSPVRWDHLGHLQLLSTMLIPVYVLFIVKGRNALERGGLRPWAYFSIAGLALAITAYDTEYYAIFLILFAALYFIYHVPLRVDPAAFRRWGQLLLGLILSGIILVVLFLPMLLAARGELAANGDYVTFPASWAPKYARDLFSFFVPQQNARFLGPIFASFTRDFAIDNVFLGWLSILLAGVGIWKYRRRRDLWFWVLAAVLFAVLAMGPDLTVNRKIITHFGPYLILTKIPVLDSLRVPARFGIITMFSVAVLAGYGASALFDLMRRKGIARAAVPIAAALIMLGIYVEYMSQYHLTRLDAPAVYSEIAARDTPGSVITLPLGWEGGAHTTGTERTFTELFQLEHERPMLGGMLARVPKEQLFAGVNTPVLDFLADPTALEPSDLDRDPKAIAAFQERYQVAFIVVHKQPPEILFRGDFMRFDPYLTPEALDRVDKYLTVYLEMEKFAEDDEIVAYRQR